jgi:hypothetical protein
MCIIAHTGFVVNQKVLFLCRGFANFEKFAEVKIGSLCHCLHSFFCQTCANFGADLDCRFGVGSLTINKVVESSANAVMLNHGID